MCSEASVHQTHLTTQNLQSVGIITKHVLITSPELNGIISPQAHLVPYLSI